MNQWLRFLVEEEFIGVLLMKDLGAIALAEPTLTITSTAATIIT
jgi:hypothetical protein